MMRRSWLPVAWSVPLVVLALGALSSAWFFPDVWPRSVSSDALRNTLGAAGTRSALVDGTVVSVLAAVVAVLLAWPAARVLASAPRWLTGLGLGVLFLPSVVPPVGLAIGVGTVLIRIGIDGTLAAVVLAHLVPTIPYAVALLTAAFVRFDERIEGQAAVLGASPRVVLATVTLPMLAPAATAALVLAFAVSWSQYLLTLLAGSGRVITITMQLATALSGGNPTSIGSVALIALAPSLLIVLLGGRRLREHIA
jgi:putative spermidine/putrescine transport system permease protein